MMNKLRIIADLPDIKSTCVDAALPLPMSCFVSVCCLDANLDTAGIGTTQQSEDGEFRADEGLASDRLAASDL